MAFRLLILVQSYYSTRYLWVLNQRVCTVLIVDYKLLLSGYIYIICINILYCLQIVATLFPDYARLHMQLNCVENLSIT